MARTTTTTSSSEDKVANIAVIGAGWWAQGWHCPVLHNNPRSNLIAIVDSSPNPCSKLNPQLEPLSVLAEKYKTIIFSSVQELLSDDVIGPSLDGVIVATPHATHYSIGKEFLKEIDRRHNVGEKPLHILMEKPMTTDIDDAISLFRLVQNETSESQFWINHTANYRIQTSMIRDVITSGKLGTVRHVMSHFASPLKWIFNDPDNDGWNKPTGNMIGNGFAWGQSSHLLAFLFHILPHCEPKSVYCRMGISPSSGADISHSATIECLGHGNSNDDDDDNAMVIISMSGTALLPGHQYSDPPIAKLVQIEVYGDDGSLHYSGNDLDPTSGRLEYRGSDGTVEVLCDRFEFEAYDNQNYGPESIQAFVDLCCGGNPEAGATALEGLRSVQVIDAMYRSHKSKQPESIVSVFDK
jgi:predicted dehydrogenase